MLLKKRADFFNYGLPYFTLLKKTINEFFLILQKLGKINNSD